MQYNTIRYALARGEKGAAGPPRFRTIYVYIYIYIYTQYITILVMVIVIVLVMVIVIGIVIVIVIVIYTTSNNNIGIFCDYGCSCITVHIMITPIAIDITTIISRYTR